MKNNIKFGARLSRVISTVAPDSENINITPYEKISWPVIKDVAQECERLGFDSIIVPDHPMDDVSRYACMSMLAALAACTETSRSVLTWRCARRARATRAGASGTAPQVPEAPCLAVLIQKVRITS